MNTGVIDYQHDETTLEAFYALPNTKQPAPAIFICHDWSGRNSFVCDKACALAELGYVGIALDVYGKGITGTTVDEKKALMSPLIEERSLLCQRLLMGVEIAPTLPQVDRERMAAIGFCFGGLCALDLARINAPLRGVASFHGILSPIDHLSPHHINSKIVVLHGHDDPMVPPDQVLAFQTEMSKANADWQIHIYGNTQHAFTNPEANDRQMGTIYNAQAAQRSWIALNNFLSEIMV